MSEFLNPIGGGSFPPTVAFYPYAGNGTTATALSGANKIQLSGFYLPFPLTVNNLVFFLSVVDAVNLYDVGIYDTTGALKAHIGAQSLASVSNDIPVIGAPVTLTAGKYYLAFTGNAVTGKMEFPSISTRFLTHLALVESSTASSGGALPSTAVIPADSWALALAVLWFGIH